MNQLYYFQLPSTETSQLKIHLVISCKRQWQPARAWSKTPFNSYQQFKKTDTVASGRQSGHRKRKSREMNQQRHQQTRQKQPYLSTHSWPLTPLARSAKFTATRNWHSRLDYVSLWTLKTPETPHQAKPFVAISTNSNPHLLLNNHLKASNPSLSRIQFLAVSHHRVLLWTLWKEKHLNQ